MASTMWLTSRNDAVVATGVLMNMEVQLVPAQPPPTYTSKNFESEKKVAITF